MGVLRTASLLQRIHVRVIEPAGITPQQYNVLRILRRLDREVDEANDGALGALTEGEQRMLVHLLDRVRAAHDA